MNFYALAPKKYKKSVVAGFVHRIYRACSSWSYFHQSLEKAKKFLRENQYPENFYEPIINASITKLVTQNCINESREGEDTSMLSQSFHDSQDDVNRCHHNIDDKDKFMYYIQYRGKCTEEYARALHKINAPCRIVMTLRKLKTVLPSLKPPVDKMIKSNVVYNISCPRCQSCYVGQTRRKLQRRFIEHVQKGLVKEHMAVCQVDLTNNDIDILGSTSKCEKQLLTLEALYQKDISPNLNTKEEYKSRKLLIKF